MDNIDGCKGCKWITQRGRCCYDGLEDCLPAGKCICYEEKVNKVRPRSEIEKEVRKFSAGMHDNIKVELLLDIRDAVCGVSE